jgi:hypothetical protein
MSVFGFYRNDGIFKEEFCVKFNRKFIGRKPCGAKGFTPLWWRTVSTSQIETSSRPLFHI